MKNETLTRRSVLRIGAMSAAGAAVTSTFARAAAFAPQASNGKVLLINLRGGWDGLHVVIPNGTRSGGAAADAKYTTLRSSLAIPFASGASIEAGNQFCTMHPSMGSAVVANGGLTPILGGNRLVFLHQVGLWSRTGSHFEDQRTVETGIPPTLATALDREEGWGTRLLGSGFDGVSVSENLQQVFQTGQPSKVLPHVRTILQDNNGPLSYTQNTSKPGIDTVYRGVLGPVTGAPFGFGLGGHYGSSPGLSNHALEAYNRAVGTSMLESETIISNLVGTTGVYAPQNGAKYPLSSSGGTTSYPTPTTEGLPNQNWVRIFMRNLRDAVWLLKSTNARVVSVELGGWDTHNAQGQLMGSMPTRLAALAYGLRAVDLDTVGMGLTTLCFSEFGRTAAENGSPGNNNGTDHGAGSVAIAMGSNVNLNGTSRVYGCDETDWPGMDSANNVDLGLTTPVMNGTFLSPRNNTLGLFARVMTSVMGTPAGSLPGILPGFDPALHTAPAFV